MVESFSANLFPALKLLEFRVLSNINNGASLRKYAEGLEMIGLMMVVLMVLTCGELILVIWGVVLF